MTRSIVVSPAQGGKFASQTLDPRSDHHKELVEGSSTVASEGNIDTTPIVRGGSIEAGDEAGGFESITEFGEAPRGHLDTFEEVDRSVTRLKLLTVDLRGYW